MRTYEAWADPENDCISLVATQGAEELRAKGLLGASADLLYRFQAATHEEAMAIHRLRMGWEPYCPVGAAAPCPVCTAMFYPEGSGECWRCGVVRS